MCAIETVEINAYETTKFTFICTCVLILYNYKYYIESNIKG